MAPKKDAAPRIIVVIIIIIITVILRAFIEICFYLSFFLLLKVWTQKKLRPTLASDWWLLFEDVLQTVQDVSPLL